MTEYSSDATIIEHSCENVFAVLSDFSKLKPLANQIPQDKASNIEFERDRCSMNINPVGKIAFVVAERVDGSAIKYVTDQFMFDASVWIRLEAKAENRTEMNISFSADLNPMMKMMIGSQLSQSMNKVAQALAMLPYDKMNVENDQQGL